MSLKQIPNIGYELQRQLYEVGIYNFDTLKEIGSKEAWLKVKQIDSNACINRLYALEGAIRNIRWHDLEKNIKKELKDFYEENKS